MPTAVRGCCMMHLRNVRDLNAEAATIWPWLAHRFSSRSTVRKKNLGFVISGFLHLLLEEREHVVDRIERACWRSEFSWPNVFNVNREKVPVTTRNEANSAVGTW